MTCEHDTRRVTRTEHDGRITVLIDRYDGKRLNAPNDVVVDSDGAIWFTDPGYGIDGEYEGHKDEAELPAPMSTAWIPRSGDGQPLSWMISFARTALPSRRTKACSMSSTAAPRMAVRRTSGSLTWTDGKLRNGRVFAEDFAPGFTDGLRVDVDGNVWCSMGWADPGEDGVRCYAPDGDLIGKIHLPETCANLCFGGKKRNRLFMCASTSIYSLYVDVQGAQLP